MPLGKRLTSRLYRERNREILAKKARERYRATHPDAREYLTDRAYARYLAEMKNPLYAHDDAETESG
jgi:hypothetical protein